MKTCGARDCDKTEIIARGYCTKHYQRAKKAGEFTPKPPPAPVDAYLHANAVMTGNCWEWTGKRSQQGYGVGRIRGRDVFAHRASFLAFIGPIPDGHHLDHLCRNRACLRPDHLEAVLPYVNYMRGIGVTAKNKRKTHCKRGHEFTPENTRSVTTKYGRPGRVCRACFNAHQRRYRAQKGAAA